MKSINGEISSSVCTEYYTHSISNSSVLNSLHDNYQNNWSHTSNFFPAEFKDTSLSVMEIDFESSSHVTSIDSNVDINKTLAKRDDIEIAASKFFQSLRMYPFEQGYNSFADIELISLKNDMSDSDFYLLLPKIWKICFSSSTTVEALHFLNCLLNLAKEIDSDAFCFCGLSAISHKDLEIKEAGIALFEKLRDSNYCAILENVGDTGVDWLDQYRLDVISDLKELL